MRSILLPASLLLVAACTSSAKEPVLASSGGSTSYAVHYSDELNAATKSVSDAQAREKTLTSGWAAHVDALKKVDWHKVEIVIDDSDQAGKSADFAAAQDDAVAIREFWDTDKNEISARVSGGTQQKLKESGCSADIGGAVSYSLGEAITKQLQKRLRSRNDAFDVIERYKVSLGPQNVSALEKLADEISEASYDVHVLMVRERGRLKRLIADKDDVKKSIDRFIKEENDFQAEPGRTEAEKKASTDRITAANKTKSELDAATSQAQAVEKEMDKSIDAAVKDYEEALKALKAKVAEKKKAEPVKA